MRKSGATAAEAVRQLDRSATSFKTTLLSRHGVPFDNVAAWQRRGFGIYWENYKKEGFDPIARKAVFASRRRLTANMDLPADETYEALLRQILRVGGKLTT